MRKNRNINMQTRRSSITRKWMAPVLTHIPRRENEQIWYRRCEIQLRINFAYDFFFLYIYIFRFESSRTFSNESDWISSSHKNKRGNNDRNYDSTFDALCEWDDFFFILFYFRNGEERHSFNTTNNFLSVPTWDFTSNNIFLLLSYAGDGDWLRKLVRPN